MSQKGTSMSRVVVFEHLTLDGVMQAPGRPDEDRRGGFEHGGWATLWDPVIAGVAEASMGATEALLLGRRTYEDFHSYWPTQTDNPFTDVLANTPKHVASRTLQEPLPWTNSTLLEGDAAVSVIRLKEQPGKDLVVLGSGELVQTLARNQPRGRVRAPDPPAATGIGTPSVRRNRRTYHTPACRREDVPQRRANHDRPADRAGASSR
jgi:dihydrofolate reductase